MAKSTGAVTVDGAGSMLKGGALAVGGTGGAAGGAGSLTLVDARRGAVHRNRDGVERRERDARRRHAGRGLAVDHLGRVGRWRRHDRRFGADDGMVTASGGALSIAGAVSGTGLLLIDAADTLNIGGAFTSGTVAFGGGGATLSLASPLATGGAISGFADNELIFLAGVQDFGSCATGDTLAISGAGGTIDLDVGAGYAQGEFNVVPVAGGTDVTVTLPCFASGTRILTERGPVAVEALRLGDRVMTPATPECPSRPVIWLGHRAVDCRSHPRPADVVPIRVRAGAFGPGMPARDLLLSPDHAVFAREVLIPVRYLLNGTTITRERTAAVTYWHVELSEHAILLAEGLPVESYLDTGNRAAFANHAGPVWLHPDFAAHTRGGVRLRAAGGDRSGARRGQAGVGRSCRGCRSRGRLSLQGPFAGRLSPGLA